MGSGAAGVQRIGGDDLRWPRRGTATWAAMQGVRGLVAWGRGRGGRGGASGLVGGAREARRPWLRRAALSGAFGDEREGEQRRRRGSREREAVEGGVEAVFVASRGGRGGCHGESGGGRRRRACVQHAAASCAGTGRRQEKGARWAGPLGELGRAGKQVSGPGGLQVMFPSLSLFFLFYFCFLLFNFVLPLF